MGLVGRISCDARSRAGLWIGMLSCLVSVLFWVNGGVGFGPGGADTPTVNGVGLTLVLDGRLAQDPDDRALFALRGSLIYAALIDLRTSGPDTNGIAPPPDPPPDQKDAGGHLGILTVAGTLRAWPWSGLVVELGPEVGLMMGASTLIPTAGGTLGYGWTWWSGSLRHGVEVSARIGGGFGGFYGLAALQWTFGDGLPEDQP
jgi:hypothetical protein